MITPRITQIMNKFTFCDYFKCVPKDIENMEINDYLAFSAILTGKTEGEKERLK